MCFLFAEQLADEIRIRVRTRDAWRNSEEFTRAVSSVGSQSVAVFLFSFRRKDEAAGIISTDFGADVPFSTIN